MAVSWFSGGSTGLTPSTPEEGNVVLGGTLNVGYGGTGANNATAARTSLGVTGILRRLYIDVADYVSDFADAGNGIAAALAEGGGREVVFTQPYGSSTTVYRIVTRRSFTIQDKTRLIWEAPTDFSTIGTSGTAMTFFNASGTIGSTTGALASDVFMGASDIPCVAGTVAALNLVSGDYIRISSSARYPAGEDTAFAGEFVRVYSISGDTITVYGTMQGNYLVSDTGVIAKTSFKTVNAVNPQIIGPGRWPTAHGDTGIGFNFCIDSNIIGGEVQRCDYNSVRVKDVLNTVIRGVTSRDDPPGLANSNVQYGIAYFNACQNLHIEECVTYGSRHGIVQSLSDSPGATRDIWITGNTVIGTWRAGIATHENCELLMLTGNRLIGCQSGFDIRVQKVILANNTIQQLASSGTGAGIGIQLSTTVEKLSSDNDTVQGGRYGVRLAQGEILYSSSVGPRDITIKNGTFDGQTQRAIELYYDQGLANAVTNATWAAGVATITTTTNSQNTVGSVVDIAGISPSGYNGRVIVQSVPTTTSFTYALVPNPGSYVSGGTVTAVKKGLNIVDNVFQNQASVAIYVNGAFNSGEISRNKIYRPGSGGSGSPIQVIGLTNFNIDGNKWDDGYASTLSLSNLTNVRQTNNGRFGEIGFRPPYAIVGSDTPNTTTSSTTNTVLKTFILPGHALGPKGSIIITIEGTHSNNANNKVWRAYAGAVGTGVTGTVLFSFTATNTASIHHQTEVFSRTSDTQFGQGSSGPAFGVATASPVTATLGQSADIEIVITGQCANAADTMTLVACKLEVFNPPPG